MGDASATILRRFLLTHALVGVEDVLARRTRALFLNARAATAMAPRVAGLLAHELGHDPTWSDAQVARFGEIASGFSVS